MASVFKPFFNYQATRNPIFHRYCIATYVKRGNPFPVVGAELKDIPSTGSGSGSAPISKSQDPSSVNPFSTSQSPWTTTSSVSPFKTSHNPAFSVKHFSTSSRTPWRRPSPLFRRPSTKLQVPSSDDEIPSSDDEILSSDDEQLVFNDDDPVVIESNVSSSKSSTIRSININTHTEFPAVSRSSSKENFHILVNLKSNVIDTDQEITDMKTSGAPIDLVTVLDVSSSMEGEKIQLLKQAMRFVIDNLGPSDRLSVISFSGHASRLFPLLLMTDSGKQRALEAVNSLVAGGYTNIQEGLKMGTKVIEDRAHKNAVHSIMLLSDGEDTWTCARTINCTDISKVQIPVHTFGFGRDHDSKMLHSISESSKATFSFIETEGFIQDAFAQCVGGLLSVAVQDLQLHIQSLDSNLCLGQLKAGSYSTSLTGDNQIGSVNIGDMYADEERDILALVKIPVVSDGNAKNPMKLFSVWCTYKDPFTKESITTEAIEVALPRPETIDEDMVASIEVNRQKNRLQATEAMNNSRDAAERGDLRKAQSIIYGCRMQMANTMHDGDEFSRNLDLELKEVGSRMGNKQDYDSLGRGLLHAGLSSHSRQQATFGSGFSSGAPGQARCGNAYKTPAMVKMGKLSRASRQNNTHEK